MLVEGDPVATGTVRVRGQRIAWQEFGAGDGVVLLMPTWCIVHTDFWRHQVPWLSQRYRVLAFDELGNGASDRPTDPEHYGDLLVADEAVAVLDACAVEHAAVMGVSQGGPWALALAVRHPDRVNAAVFIAPNAPLAAEHAECVAADERFNDVHASHDGWSKWNRHYWLSNFHDFLRFFFSRCFTEPDSQEQIDHFFDMGAQTTPEALLASLGTDANQLTAELASSYARRVRCPSLVIHGDQDAITPLARGEELARLAGSELIVMAGSGHEPQCRNHEVVNAHINSFLETANVRRHP